MSDWTGEKHSAIYIHPTYLSLDKERVGPQLKIHLMENDNFTQKHHIHIVDMNERRVEYIKSDYEICQIATMEQLKINMGCHSSTIFPRNCLLTTEYFENFSQAVSLHECIRMLDLITSKQNNGNYKFLKCRHKYIDPKRSFSWVDYRKQLWEVLMEP